MTMKCVNKRDKDLRNSYTKLGPQTLDTMVSIYNVSNGWIKPASSTVGLFNLEETGYIAILSEG